MEGVSVSLSRLMFAVPGIAPEARPSANLWTFLSFCVFIAFMEPVYHGRFFLPISWSVEVCNLYISKNARCIGVQNPLALTSDTPALSSPVTLTTCIGETLSFS